MVTLLQKRFNVKKFKLIILAIAITSSSSCYASVVLNSTRVIYNEGEPQVSLQLLNKSKGPHLVQSWITNQEYSSNVNEKTPFSIYPPISIIPRNGGQLLSIKRNDNFKINSSKVESVYYIHVLDLPDSNYKSNNETNADLTGHLDYAIESTIKLFYRPKSIIKNIINKSSYTDVKFKFKDGSISLFNNRPYYLTVTGVFNNKQRIKNITPFMIPPFSTKILKTKINVNTLSIQVMDDLGATLLLSN